MGRRPPVGGVLALALWGALAGAPAGGTRLRGRAPPARSRRLLYYGDDGGIYGDDVLDDGDVYMDSRQHHADGRPVI